MHCTQRQCTDYEKMCFTILSIVHIFSKSLGIHDILLNLRKLQILSPDHVDGKYIISNNVLYAQERENICSIF